VGVLGVGVLAVGGNSVGVQGNIVGEFSTGSASIQEIGMLMTGQNQ